MSRGAQLRELLAGEELIVAPGVFDGISAALVGKVGFAAAYMTGAGVCASSQGLPDIGLLTLTEMAERASVLAGLLCITLQFLVVFLMLKLPQLADACFRTLEQRSLGDGPTLLFGLRQLSEQSPQAERGRCSAPSSLIYVALKLDSAVHGNVRSFDPIGIAL